MATYDGHIFEPTSLWCVCESTDFDAAFVCYCVGWVRVPKSPSEPYFIDCLGRGNQREGLNEL